MSLGCPAQWLQQHNGDRVAGTRCGADGERCRTRRGADCDRRERRGSNGDWCGTRRGENSNRRWNRRRSNKDRVRDEA